MKVLLFELDERRHAVKAAAVEQVARAVASRPLPAAPAVVAGVIDVHGQVVPLFDLRARLGLERRAPALTDHLVVARAGKRTVAFTCDRAVGLAEVDDAALDDGKNLALGQLEHVAGIARLPDGLLFIHDLREFLSQAESEALDAALDVEA